MKAKYLALFLILLPISGFATGDSTVTSQAYVTSQLANKQGLIGDGTNGTVITNTGTAGMVGSKAVYTTGGTYSDQQNALIEANQANSAIQNGLNAHVTCYDSANGCTLWQVHDLNGTYMP